MSFWNAACDLVPLSVESERSAWLALGPLRCRPPAVSAAREARPLLLPAPFPGFSLALVLVGVPGDSQSRAWPSLWLSFWLRIGSRAVLGLSRNSQHWWL